MISEERHGGGQQDVPPNQVEPVERAGTEEQQLPYPDLPPVVLGLDQTKIPRSWCLQVTRSRWFDYLSRLMVILSCVTLCIVKPYEELNIYFEMCEGFILAYFFVEMIAKMMALGGGRYLGNNWNKFAVFINFGELLDYFLGYFSPRWQFFQVLRPMRLLGRLQSLRVLWAVLVETLPMFCNVFLIIITVIHAFAVGGVQMWAGRLRNRCYLGEDIPTMYNVDLHPFYVPKFGDIKPFLCSSEQDNGMRTCRDIPPFRVDGKTCLLNASSQTANRSSSAVNDTSDCVNWNQYYNVCQAGDRNPHKGVVNFDHITYAWISIFQMLTLEGWAQIMYFVMDTYSYWGFIYFILATLTVSVFVMNICAVVIATKFAENLGRTTEEQCLSRQESTTLAELLQKFTFWFQRIFCRQNRVATMAGNSRTNILARVWTSCEETLKKILESRLFDCLVLFTVTISVISLAVEHHNQPERLTQVLWIADIICGVIFFVEMILKLLVSKGKYFINLYNIIDLVIIITSLNELVTGKLPILRVLRVLRFLKLLQCMPYLQRKLGKLFGAVKKSPGFFLFLLCITFSFSTLGMLLFGGKFHFETVYGDIYSARKNFDTMELAMITVFEVYTKDSWNRVLYSAISSTSPWATLYFFMITMLGNYVVLNVLVGMVIQSFRSVPKPNTNLLPGPGPGPSRTPVTILAPDQHHALPDIIDESLTFIERIVRWFRNHMDWSLFMLSPRNRFRVFCQRVVFHSMFEIVFLVLIFLSYIPLIIERPGINPQSMERFFLKVSNYTFSAVFLVEMLLKVFAMGLFFGKDSYSRSGWNIMDGLLVILSLVHICISLVGTSEPTVLSTLRVFRVLRMLRSLRLIKRAPRLKLAVEALQASIKPISSVVLMCAAWLLFYATLGVQLFKGKFFHCLGQDITNITTKSDCLTAGYKWVRKPFNFDNTPQAMLSLFVMFSRSGWMTIMYDGLDAVGVDLQPIKDYNDWMHLYFISFMVVNFLLLDMFIGVMVETFRECHREQRRGDEAGDEQQQHRVQEPEDTQYFTNYPWLRRRIHTLCTSRFMELFTANVVFVSTIFMGLEHYNQPHYVGLIVQCSFGVFTVILIIEVLLRLVAFGVLRFMTDGWNLLDLLVVLFSLLKVIFHQLNMSRIIPINPGLFRVFRLLRLSQVLRNKRARILLSTVQKTILQVGSICFLFVFFFCIYAALGVQLFGRLVCTEDYRCLGINQYINFRHFGTALLALYQIATGDNWSGILKDTLKECPPDAYICSNFLSWVTPIYFISFVVMAQFTLLNLVIAAIMQALEDSTQDNREQANRISQS